MATIVFFVLSLAPGDPTALYFAPGMSPEVLDQVRRNMGLDDPLLVRYVRWIVSFLQGDFGQSLAQNIPVRDLILGRAANTVVLAGGALLLSFAAGIALGVLQAVRHNSFLDSAAGALALFFYSMPSFWLAIMLILVFSVNAGGSWDWPLSFPPSGVVGADHDLLGPVGQLRDRVMHMVLPLLTLTLVLTAGISRYVRVGMLEVLEQDYVRTARAKGLPEWKVTFKHAFRNALIPVVTLFGVYFPFLLSGTVFVEWVFSWPGMGSLMVEAIQRDDYPVVLAGTVLFGATVVLGNLLADLLYGVVDPRVRHERG